jgi:pyruvate,water dikinase
MVGRLGLAAWRQPRTHVAFMARVAAVVPARVNQSQVTTMPLSRLAAEYRRIEAALLDRWDAPIVNDFLCMMAYGGSRRLLERWGGPAGVALHNDVMIGQGDIISAEPARLIRAAAVLARCLPGAEAALAAGDPAVLLALPGLGDRLRAYLERFGDRRIGELKLEQPTLDEQPAPLFAAVRAAAASATAPPERPGPEATVNALFRGQPLRRWLARWALNYAKARVRDRENLRFERTRIFGYARRVFQAMGRVLAAQGVLEQPDDVFFLTVPEVLGAAEGLVLTSDLKALVGLRRAEHAAAARQPEPPARVLVRGSVADPSARIARGPAATPPIAETGDRDPVVRSGTACGGGIATGPVRVIRDPLTEPLASGEVLVARHTDPGWICHFAHAAAVVVERGSVLSHSAIVSRELGIPCVVALPDACQWLKTGEPVRVDGSRGIVRRLDPSGEPDHG